MYFYFIYLTTFTYNKIKKLFLNNADNLTTASTISYDESTVITLDHGKTTVEGKSENPTQKTIDNTPANNDKGINTATVISETVILYYVF